MGLTLARLVYDNYCKGWAGGERGEKGRAARAGQGKTQEAAISQSIDKSNVLILSRPTYCTPHTV